MAINIGQTVYMVPDPDTLSTWDGVSIASYKVVALAERGVGVQLEEDQVGWISVYDVSNSHEGAMLEGIESLEEKIKAAPTPLSLEEGLLVKAKKSIGLEEDDD